MRLTIILIFLFLGVHAVNAQRSAEIGVTGGGMWYNGELNPSRQFNPIHLAGGLVFRHNFNYRYSWRLTAIMGNVSGSDANSGIPFQTQRGIRFSSRITEVASVIEFNFLPYEIGSGQYLFTPYVFGGLSVFKMDPRSSGPGSSALRPLLNEPGKKYSVIQPAVPFGMGLKLSLFRRLGLFAEWGMRKTYTDYIDDVSTTWASGLTVANGAEIVVTERAGFQRGNSKNKDWYSFAGVGIVYLLKKKKPCPGIGL